MNILDTIGNTPLVELKEVVPSNSARVIAKLEWSNPTGSMKDRMARAAIESAENDGRLLPGGTVVEYTGGTQRGFHWHSYVLQKGISCKSCFQMPSVLKKNK